MDEATLSRMFEPFFTTKGQGKGTGLGLATVYAIAKDAGGGVWAHSAIGCGTTFKVCLPRVDDPAERIPASCAGLSALHGTESILLVEDEPLVRALAVQALASHGYRVLEAPHALAALEVLEKARPVVDLMITDVVMPGLTGKELADRARASRPDLKVLFMSGYTAEATFQRGVSAEDPRFIQKPFLPGDFVARVRRIFDEAITTPESRRPVHSLQECAG